ncbi:MAG: AAA family ATPase, partial [Deltaproteobacteria bacterium]|nr:AAA family ATPase [Deltaproteobacteria bacterium]
MKGTADPSDSRNGIVLRDRAVRLFKFLRELARLRRRIVRDLFEYERVVWFHDMPEYKGCFSILGLESDTSQDTTWLEVRKSPEPKRPPIPTACQRWLEDTDEDNPEAEPKLRDEIPTRTSHTPGYELNLHPQDEASTPPVERLSDHPEILEKWDRWKQDYWRPWLEAHSRWKAADDIYCKLFSMHQQMKKLAERYELLLGLGLLTWETPNNQVIRRHIVVGDAYLTFDANKAKFELQAAPEGVKLHFEPEMIDQNYLPPLNQQKEFESMLGLVQESPWNKDETDKILRSFIHSISPQGVYSDSLSPPDRPPKAPTITFAPALILRQRTQRSQIQCLSSIIDQISKGGNIPSGIEILCEEPEQVEDSDESKENAGTQITDGTLYLPLPTNEEQEQILYQIKSQHGILVQGPPGTGKSHTIANIICHLLAQGKRVLVTSQTPRALKVLKEKIPTEMSALCVTLLGNDQAARQELEESVSGINQKYSDWNPVQNQRLITRLEEHLYELRKDKANKERLLREQREIDTYHHEVAGGNYKGTAQQIAQRVAAEESKFAWLEDTIENDESCPLSNDEFRELLRLYRNLPEEYSLELKKELVNRELIPDMALFIRLIDDEKKTKQALSECESQRGSLR